jgi:hypothetical protein
VSAKHKIPAWVTRGKTIRQLIEELQSFEDQNLEVRISLKNADSHRPISILEKHGRYCVLANTEAYHAGPWQKFMDDQVAKSKGRVRASKKKKA